MEHTHDHEHEHVHEHYSSGETLALLTYMLEHNRHHAEELQELSIGLDEETSQLLHEAVVDLTVGNEKLAEVVRILKEED